MNFHVSVELVIKRKRHGRKLQVSSCHWFICEIFCRIYNKEEGHSRLWEKRSPKLLQWRFRFILSVTEGHEKQL